MAKNPGQNHLEGILLFLGIIKYLLYRSRVVDTGFHRRTGPGPNSCGDVWMILQFKVLTRSKVEGQILQGAQTLCPW